MIYNNVIYSKNEEYPKLERKVKVENCKLKSEENNIKNVLYNNDTSSYKDITYNKKEQTIKLFQVNKIDDTYKTYIESTGDSFILKTIIDSVSSLKDIIILSTPRNEDYFINPLIINRKNLTIYGGHELTGYSEEFRNNVFHDILQSNIKNERLIEHFISFHKFSSKKLEELLKKKQNYIDVFKY